MVPKSVERGRSDIIDAFRALAMAGVMAFHYLVRGAPPFNGHDLLHHNAVYPPAFEIGRVGVHLFFVISGFVIALTLSRSANAIEFAWRRFSRLYPAFVLCLCLTVVTVRMIGPEEYQVRARDILANLTILGPGLGFRFVDGAYWSLAVEAAFYGWAALFFFLLGQRFWIGLLGLAIIGQLAALIDERVATLLFFWKYAGFFLVGIGAWLWLVRKQTANALLLTACGLLISVRYLYAAPLVGSQPWMLILAVFASAALMFGTLRLWPTLKLGGLGYVGRVTYPLYLIHQAAGISLIRWLHDRFGASDAIAVTVTSVVALVAAVAIHELVELPAQRWLLSASLGQRVKLRCGTGRWINNGAS